MNKKYCKHCGRELKPAPANFDGIPTFVGYLPCNCREESSPHYHHWDSGAYYHHSHKGGKIPHGHHGSRYGFGDFAEQIRRQNNFEAYLETYCRKCEMWPVCEASNIEDCMRRDAESGFHVKRILLDEDNVKKLWASGEGMIKNPIKPSDVNAEGDKSV